MGTGAGFRDDEEVTYEYRFVARTPPRRRNAISFDEDAFSRMFRRLQISPRPTMTRARSASPIRNRPNDNSDIVIIRHEMKLVNGCYVLQKKPVRSENASSATPSGVSWARRARPTYAQAASRPAKCRNPVCTGSCVRCVAVSPERANTNSTDSSTQRALMAAVKGMSQSATTPKASNPASQTQSQDTHATFSSDDLTWKSDLDCFLTEEIDCLTGFNDSLQTICNQLRALRRDVIEATDNVNSLRAKQKESAENLEREAKVIGVDVQHIKHGVLGMEATTSVMEATSARVVEDFGKLIVASRYMEDATTACKKADRIILRNERVQRAIKKYGKKHADDQDLGGNAKTE